ncbi:unnamed protein product [Cyclocybe aegerita]|uniref:PLL-like beta propeller domain-containing protein n=1 Tax=Cyclocybe aegerita TaxID=1973307 RepID=A0A8S0XGX5_CYCAE|nr:unnamed protein product [Cyclocybe aegerita]
MTSYGPNQVELFVVGADSALQHKWFTGSWGPGQTSYQNLSGRFLYDPECIAFPGNPNRLTILVVGTESAIYHKWWDGTAWGPSATSYELLGGNAIGSPTAVAWSATRLDVFVIGTDCALYHKWWDGSSWGPSYVGNWENLGGTWFSHKPAVVSLSANRLDCFVTGTDNALWHRSWDGSLWSPWKSLGGQIVGDPVAVWSGGEGIDVFARGLQDSALWHLAWNGT